MQINKLKKFLTSYKTIILLSIFTEIGIVAEQQFLKGKHLLIFYADFRN